LQVSNTNNTQTVNLCICWCYQGGNMTWYSAVFVHPVS